MIIRGKSPLRISLAGGGTDLNYIFEKYGGAVVNCTIDKYCHMSLEKRKDNKKFINGKDYKKDVLGKIVVENFKPSFGFNLTYYNDIAPGSGLGNSSSFVVLLLTLLFEAKGEVISDDDMVQMAYNIEQNIKEGGWQDQYATSIGGFNFMEFSKIHTVYPLRLRYRFLQELSEHLILIHIEGDKNKKDIHKKMREHEEKNIKDMEKTAKIKELAYKMRDCLLNQKIEEIGKILDENWKLKRNKFTSNRKIDRIYELAKKNGAIGGKICGSGQAGHMLFFVSPEHRTKLIKEINLPVVNFNLSKHGTETWQI